MLTTSVVILCLICCAQTSPLKEKQSDWNYVNVRPHAYMFWWLYYTTAPGSYTEKPLILWLQGGPGGSSTGFGNFNEIGPLDVKLNKRNTTWVSVANVLFIDNPVGTGFSYTTDDSAFARDDATISDDLVAVMKSFLNGLPAFKTVPFYIFSESYGGKMTAAFSQGLHKAIHSGELKCNFKGFAMGDSWISPASSTLSWGPYLYATSIVDEAGRQVINNKAREAEAAVKTGQWEKATTLWDETETVVGKSSNGVNWYNILQWGEAEQNLKFTPKSTILKDYINLERLYNRHVARMQNDDLSKLMNGVVRQMLGTIPKNVTWGGQSDKVFFYQRTEFMKPVVNIVNDLLSTDLSVVVYSGQLDLIVNTLGTEAWIQTLKWPGLAGYKSAARKPLYVDNKTAGFVKQFKNFSFYWILDAGHMVPKDAGEAALEIVKRITQQ